jgi:hypothetical protein
VGGGQGLGEAVEFGLGARDEEEVKAFARELEGVLFADAIGRACDDGVGVVAAEFGELVW